MQRKGGTAGQWALDLSGDETIWRELLARFGLAWVGQQAHRIVEGLETARERVRVAA